MRGVTRIIALLAAVTPAAAQTPASSDAAVLLLPVVHYGAPLRWAGGLTVYLPHEEPGMRSHGWIAEGSAGQGGMRASAGRASVLEYLEVDARAMVMRTWALPRAATTRSTYLGGEAGLSIAYVRFSAGLAHRVAGVPGEHATTFTWSAGVQVPLHR